MGAWNVGTFNGDAHRVVAKISVLTKNSTLAQVTSITDTEGFTWHKAGAANQSGITEPSGSVTGSPVTMEVSIWYTDHLVDADWAAPTTYEMTVNTDNEIDTIWVNVCRHRFIYPNNPLDHNASFPASDTQMSSSTAVLSASSLATDTANVQIVTVFGAVGPGQRPNVTGDADMDGDTSSDYGLADVFYLNQNYHIFSDFVYDKTAALAAATIQSRDAVKNGVMLAVAFTQDNQLTSYSNFGGTGDRRGLINVWSELGSSPSDDSQGLGSTPWSAMIDGTSVSGAFFNNASLAVSGKVVFQFDFFSVPRIIDEVTLTLDRANSTSEVMQWQGSVDGVAWDNLGPTCNFNGTVITYPLGGNTTAYQSYRMLGISGNVTNTPNFSQFEFRIDNNAASGSEYINATGANVAFNNSSSGNVSVTTTLDAWLVLIVECNHPSGTGHPAVSTVTDDNGNTWTRRSGHEGALGSNWQFVDYWYTRQTTPDTTTVTVTMTSNTDSANLHIIAFANLPDMSTPWKTTTATSFDYSSGTAAVPVMNYPDITGQGLAIVSAVTPFFGGPIASDQGWDHRGLELLKPRNGGFNNWGYGNHSVMLIADTSSTAIDIRGTTPLIDMLSDVINLGGGSTSITGTWASAEDPDIFAAFAANEGTFDTTEDPDIFEAISGVRGPWASTEDKDIFNAVQELEGTFDAIETPDAFKGFLFNPPTGVWDSTEERDTFANSAYSRLDIEEITGNTSSNGFTATTNGPNRIIVYIAAGVAVGQLATNNSVLSITGDGVGASMVWHRGNVVLTGPDEDQNMIRTEMWYAHAPLKLTGVNFNVTYSSGFSFTALGTAFAIKGLNGGYNDALDKNPFARGYNSGAFNGVASNPQASLRLATGPVSASGSSYDSITFDPSQSSHVTLASGDLIVNSDGTPQVGDANYAMPLVENGKTSGLAYYEVEFTHIAGDKYGTGAFYLGQHYPPLAWTTSGIGGAILRGDGSIWSNGSHVADLGTTPVDGDIIGVSMDLDLGSIYFQNATQRPGFWNGNSYMNPTYRDMGGIPMALVQLVAQPGGGFAPQSVGGPVVPAAALDGDTVAAEQSYNFGNTPFLAQPVGVDGWLTQVPAVPPVPVKHPGVIVGWQCAVNDYDALPLDPPPGFQRIRYISQAGGQRALCFDVYVQVRRDTNVILPDNEFQIAPVPTVHWHMGYDAFQVGSVDPGSWESTEATDYTFMVGGVGSGGARNGFWASTEATDIFHGTGSPRVAGVWNSTEAKDIFSGFLKQPINGTFNVTEAKDIFTGAGIGWGEDGVWNSTEEVDILTITGIVPIVGTFDTTETVDRFRAIGAGVILTHRRRRGFIA